MNLETDTVSDYQVIYFPSSKFFISVLKNVSHSDPLTNSTGIWGCSNLLISHQIKQSIDPIAD